VDGAEAVVAVGASTGLLGVPAGRTGSSVKPGAGPAPASGARAVRCGMFSAAATGVVGRTGAGARTGTASAPDPAGVGAAAAVAVRGDGLVDPGAGSAVAAMACGGAGAAGAAGVVRGAAVPVAGVACGVRAQPSGASVGEADTTVRWVGGASAAASVAPAKPASGARIATTSACGGRDTRRISRTVDGVASVSVGGVRGADSGGATDLGLGSAARHTPSTTIACSATTSGTSSRAPRQRAAARPGGAHRRGPVGAGAWEERVVATRQWCHQGAARPATGAVARRPTGPAARAFPPLCPPRPHAA
jgi:hypothetical protein